MVPDESSATSTWQPIADYVGKVSGKKVEVKQSSNYAALIEASIAGQVDVVSFSAFTYLQAKAKGAQFTPVGASVRGCSVYLFDAGGRAYQGGDHGPD